jgi:isopentenyl-diphosphate delta-isomerase
MVELAGLSILNLDYSALLALPCACRAGRGLMAPNLAMIVDVVDERNRTVGVAERRSLFQRKLGFRTVDILLFDKNDRMVLQLLPPDHLRNPNRLGASVAGYLRAGETYLEAARRKLRAELHITARIRSTGQFEMIDEGCRKFVGVFVGKLHQRPAFNVDEIAELVYLDTKEVERRVSNRPGDFTPTFLLAYEHLRRWKRDR